MKTGAAIREGFRLARETRSAVWVLFLANLGLAALAGLPIYWGILRFTGHSLMTRELLSGFSVDWLTDFAVNNTGSLERYAMVITLVGMLSIPVNSILVGGVLARFRAPEQTSSLGDFFRDTARYAWRLLRLMAIALVFYWIVFRVLNQGLGNFVNKRTHEWLDDLPVFWTRLATGLLVLVALGFVNLVVDYARVKLVLDDTASAGEAFLAAMGFVFGRFRKALVVYAVPSLGGLAMLGIYSLVVPWQLINAPLPEASRIREPLTLALLFVGQQLVMFGRTWFRAATWASEWTYYSRSR